MQGCFFCCSAESLPSPFLFCTHSWSSFRSQLLDERFLSCVENSALQSRRVKTTRRHSQRPAGKGGVGLSWGPRGIACCTSLRSLGLPLYCPQLVDHIPSAASAFTSLLGRILVTVFESHPRPGWSQRIASAKMPLKGRILRSQSTWVLEDIIQSRSRAHMGRFLFLWVSSQPVSATTWYCPLQCNAWTCVFYTPKVS